MNNIVSYVERTPNIPVQENMINILTKEFINVLVVTKNYMSKIELKLIRSMKWFVSSSSSKFDSHCGWPAFSSSLGTSVRREIDADGYRQEILCANCNGHLGLFCKEFFDWLFRWILGHVFHGEGLRDASGKIIKERHCVNSASLKFEKKK